MPYPFKDGRKIAVISDIPVQELEIAPEVVRSQLLLTCFLIHLLRK